MRRHSDFVISLRLISMKQFNWQSFCSFINQLSLKPFVKTFVIMQHGMHLASISTLLTLFVTLIVPSSSSALPVMLIKGEACMANRISKQCMSTQKKTQLV